MKTTAQPVSRWVNWTAHAIPLAVLPSGLWRIAMGIGVPLGFTGSMAELYDAPSWPLTPYVFALSLISEFFAFLAIGLVRPWGEVFPRWIPFAGGRNVPVLFAVTVAALGSVLVMGLTFAGAASWSDAMSEPGSPHGAAAWVMNLAYLPVLAWGPLLAIVTVAYFFRRTHSISESRAGSKPMGKGASAVN